MLSSLVLGRSVLREAVASVGYRLNGPEAGVVQSRIDTLVHNMGMLLPVFGWKQAVGVLSPEVVLATCLVLLSVPVTILIMLVSHRRVDRMSHKLIGLTPLVGLPYAWFLTANNHSGVHYWMTYRIQAVAVFVVAFGVLYCFEPAFLRDAKFACREIPSRMKWFARVCSSWAMRIRRTRGTERHFGAGVVYRHRHVEGSWSGRYQSPPALLEEVIMESPRKRMHTRYEAEPR